MSSIKDVVYIPTIWEDNVTPVNAVNLNNIENGIKGVTDAYNNLGGWVKKDAKPPYTATEVGADPTGEAMVRISNHNTSASAHSGVLALKKHTHVIDDIADIRTFTSPNSYRLGGAEPSYYLNYENITNKPKEKTDLNQFNNEDHFVKASEIKLQATGAYSSGYVTNKMEFTTAFKPVEVIIVEKVAVNSEVINTYTFTVDYKDDEHHCYVLFLNDGFSVQCPLGWLLNIPDRVYCWYALSVPYDNVEVKTNKVTVIDENSTDEQYPTAKAVYDYVNSRLGS